MPGCLSVYVPVCAWRGRGVERGRGPEMPSGILGIVVLETVLRARVRVSSRGGSAPCPGSQFGKGGGLANRVARLVNPFIRWTLCGGTKEGERRCNGGLWRQPQDPLLSSFLPSSLYPLSSFLILCQLPIGHVNYLGQGHTRSKYAGTLAPGEEGWAGNQTLRAAQRNQNLWKSDCAPESEVKDTSPQQDTENRWLLENTPR